MAHCGEESRLGAVSLLRIRAARRHSLFEIFIELPQRHLRLLVLGDIAHDRRQVLDRSIISFVRDDDLRHRNLPPVAA